MSDVTNTNAAAWPKRPLGDIFRISGDQVSPMAFSKAEFVHYSIPAWDATGGPAIELGNQIESNKTAILDASVLVSKLNPRKPRVVAVPAPTARTCCSTEFICYQPKRASEDLSFWAAYFASTDFSGRLARIAVGSTNSHTRASPKETLKWLVPEVPPHEQRKIAQVLDLLNSTIHETEAIVAKLKTVKQGLLHDLLTRGIDANGELRPPQSEAPHLYKQSPLGWIPKEWEAWPLAKSIQLVSGQHIPSELCNIVGKGVPYFTGPSDFLGASTVVTQYTNYPQIMCDAGDILITVKGSGCGKVAVASVRACISRQLMAIKVPHSTLQYWLAVFQNQQELLNRLATGGNIPGISRTQILNLTLPTPRSANEMSEIGDRICTLDSQLVAEQQFLEKLRLQRAGLMDDLLTGRVRVTPLLQEAQYA